MAKPVVAIVRYEKPLVSARKAVSLSNGFVRLPRGAKVFIKPNIARGPGHGGSAEGSWY